MNFCLYCDPGGKGTFTLESELCGNWRDRNLLVVASYLWHYCHSPEWFYTCMTLFQCLVKTNLFHVEFSEIPRLLLRLACTMLLLSRALLVSCYSILITSIFNVTILFFKKKNLYCKELWEPQLTRWHINILNKQMFHFLCVSKSICFMVNSVDLTGK